MLADNNPSLASNWGKDPSFDGRLHVALERELAATGRNVNVTNFSRDGLSTDDALAKDTQGDSLWSTCLAAKPDIVVINFGCNDQGDGIELQVFEENLQLMIDQAIEEGIAPVLATSLYVDYPNHYTYDRNALEHLGGYSAVLGSLAKVNSTTVVDMRARFKSEVLGGNWDLYARNDESYYAFAENGTEPPSPAYYANIHPWFEGVAVMADEMATRLLSCEPKLGGNSAHPDRSLSEPVS